MMDRILLNTLVDSGDVEYSDLGSIVMVTPLTDAARDWVEANVPLESWQWLGNAFCVEPRYAGALLEGMIDDGLELQHANV